MEQEIKKIVIPAAGFGTRFLPQTKAIPKEMLPIVDRPVISYVVEEAVASGIKTVIIISGYHKRAIEDYFDNFKELETFLREHGKYKELAKIKEIAKIANIIIIRQKGEHYGNAVPVLCAKPAIGNEFFAVSWGDEFIKANPPRLSQMIEAFKKYSGAIISGVRIEPKENVSRYGVGDVEHVEENIYKVKRIVEKPKPEEAPSNLGTIGSFILPPKIFDIIENLKPSKGGELWLTEAINQLIASGFPVYIVEIKNAKYYDTGNKLEYLKTVVDFALSNPEIGKEFKDYLKSLNL